MIDDAPIGAFLDDVASERVSPAGGSVVALAGAMGAALCEMACIHTTAAQSRETEQKTDENTGVAEGTDFAATDFEAIRADLAAQRRRLLALAEKDATLVDDLFGRGSDPTSRENDGDSAGPPDRLAKRAAGIPLATAEASAEVLEDAAVVIERGNPRVAADATAGAYLADAAVRASLATVRTNLDALDDTPYATTIEERCAQTAATAAEIRRQVLSESAEADENE